MVSENLLIICVIVSFISGVIGGYIASLEYSDGKK